MSQRSLRVHAMKAFRKISGMPCARGVATMAAICVLLGASRPAKADPAARDSTLAIGLKAGYVPPVLVALSAGVHVPHLYLGIFGLPPYAVVAGDQFVVGAEIALEAAPPNRDGGYLSVSLFHDQSLDGRAANPENGEVVTGTIGYEWKWNWVELTAGAGVLFVLAGGCRVAGGSPF